MKDKGKYENVEIDSIMIKSHLNDSLDINGISVSEELINRTLEAIKAKQEKHEGDSANIDAEMDVSEGIRRKKLIFRSGCIRILSGAAAAILLFMVGYGMVGNTRYSAKKDSSSNSKEMVTQESYDIQDGDEEASNYGTAAADSVTEDNSRMFSIAAVPSEMSYTFDDIFPVDWKLAAELTITDESSGDSIKVTGQDEILEFYTMMEQYQFTSNPEATVTGSYQVEVSFSEPEDLKYKLVIGDCIIVNAADGMTDGRSIYIAADPLQLLRDISDYYQKYKE